MKIIEIPADNFFPTRYTIERDDGEQSIGLRTFDRAMCERLLTFRDDIEGGFYYVVKRKGKGKPWTCVGKVKGTCLAAADIKAWLHGFMPEADPNFRVLHSDDWTAYQTRQHLKAIKMR